MRTKYLVAALAASCLTSTAAYAAGEGDDQPTGFYIGGSVGIAKLDDVDVDVYDVGGTFGGVGAEDTIEGEVDFKSGTTFGGVVGYDFGMIRADVEGSYARNKLRSVTIDRVNGATAAFTPADRADICDFVGADPCGGSGNTFDVDDFGIKARQLNAMGNLWLDVPLGPVTPYVGGGVGFSNFEVEDEDKTKFAWQLGAGVALNITPALALTADYRHRRVGKTDFEFDDFSGARIGKIKTDTFSGGLRFYFGGRHVEEVEEYSPPPQPAYTPPPPPPEYIPPPPPPPPAPDLRSGERG